LDALARIAAGDPAGGAVARLDASERFGWLVAPSSTIIQPSPVHTGLCDDPQTMLDRLFDELVAPGAGAGPAPGSTAATSRTSTTRGTATTPATRRPTSCTASTRRAWTAGSSSTSA